MRLPLPEQATCPVGALLGVGWGTPPMSTFAYGPQRLEENDLITRVHPSCCQLWLTSFYPTDSTEIAKAGGLADRQQKTETRPYAKLPSDSLSLHERDDSVVKSASCCSSKGPEFSFYHPHKVAHRCPSFHLHEIQCPQLAYRQRGTPLPFHIWIHSLTQKYTHTHYSGLSG